MTYTLGPGDGWPEPGPPARVLPQTAPASGTAAWGSLSGGPGADRGKMAPADNGHVGRLIALPVGTIEHARLLKAHGSSLGVIAAKSGNPEDIPAPVPHPLRLASRQGAVTMHAASLPADAAWPGLATHSPRCGCALYESLRQAPGWTSHSRKLWKSTTASAADEAVPYT